MQNSNQPQGTQAPIALSKRRNSNIGTHIHGDADYEEAVKGRRETFLPNMKQTTGGRRRTGIAIEIGGSQSRKQLTYDNVTYARCLVDPYQFVHYEKSLYHGRCNKTMVGPFVINIRSQCDAQP